MPEIDLTMEGEKEYRQRKMHLEALERDTPKVWRDLRPEYKVDKEFILKALQSPRLPNKSEFERQFPQSLRFDRDVVLAFCARPDFKQIYYDRHLFVPECLTNDKEVMLAYCRQIPRSLQECSEELCDDKEVVEAAIGLDGLELQYASHRLQENREIVVAACQNNGQALELCPRGPVFDTLTSDRDFMLSVLRKHGGPMLRLVAEPLRNDRELLLEALKHGMRYRWCPFEFQNDKAFVQEALANRASLYLEMNRTTQSQFDLARAAITSETSYPEIHDKALAHQPSLIRQREVALALARRGDTSKLADFLIDGETTYRFDREIMLVAVERCPKLFSRLGPNLQRDLPIVMAAINHDTAVTVLNLVGAAFQQEHPEVTVRAITVANQSNLRLIQASIPPALLVTFDVAVAWVKRLHRLPPGVNNTLLGNRDFALNVAKYAHRQFASVSETLRQDIDFVREAVDINGLVLRHAAAPLRRDLELVVRAVASNRNSLCPSIPISLAEVREHLQSKLDLHQSFMNDFLRGIAVSTPHIPPARRSQLPLLDRGVETSQAFKQLIAQFLGVPVGTELALLRKAWNKLQDPASTDDPSDADVEVFVDVLEDPDPAFPAAIRRMRARRIWQLNRARAAAAADDNNNNNNNNPNPMRLLGRGARANAAAVEPANFNNDNARHMRGFGEVGGVNDGIDRRRDIAFQPQDDERERRLFPGAFPFGQARPGFNGDDPERPDPFGFLGGRIDRPRDPRNPDNGNRRVVQRREAPWNADRPGNVGLGFAGNVRPFDEPRAAVEPFARANQGVPPARLARLGADFRFGMDDEDEDNAMADFEAEMAEMAAMEMQMNEDDL